MRGLVKRALICIACLIAIFILIVPGILGWYGLHVDTIPLIIRLLASFLCSSLIVSIFFVLWGFFLQHVLSLPAQAITWVITGKWVKSTDGLMDIDPTLFFITHAKCFRVIFDRQINRQETQERPWHAYNRQTPNTDLDYTRSLKELDEYLNTDEYEKLRKE
jgi:hypothetical protein